MKKSIYCAVMVTLLSGVAVTLGQPPKLPDRNIRTDENEILELRTVGHDLSLPVSGTRHTPKDADASNDGCLLNEDFEGCSAVEPYPLPEGWVSYSKTSDATACFLGAALGTETEAFPGASGSRYAVCPGSPTNAVDAWMFSPAVYLEKGKSYDIFFTAFKPKSPDGWSIVSLKAGIFSAQNDAALEETIIDRDATLGNWTIFSFTFMPTVSQNYYIGFNHNAGPRNYVSAIDDVQVSESAPRAVYNPDVLLPDKLSVKPYEEGGELTIANIGGLPLTLELLEISDGMEIEGTYLEACSTVEPSGWQTISVKLTANEPGKYTGTIKFKTNDPQSPVLTFNCSALIIEPVVGGYLYEDFASGKPEGWELTEFYFRPNKGVDDSRCIENWALFPSDIITRGVEMGNNPTLSFYYRALEGNGSIFKETPVTSVDQVRINVYLSADYGATWERIYRIASSDDADRAHVRLVDFTKIEVPVPDKFKDEICFAKINVEIDNYLIQFDNVELGTCLPGDIGVQGFYGNGIARSGDTTEWKVEVYNLGNTDISGTDYTILLKDETDQELASVDGIDLKASGKGVVSFKYTPKEVGYTSLKVVVDASDDPNPINDTSITVPFRVLRESDIKTDAPDIVEGDTLGLSMYVPVNFYYHNSLVQGLYQARELGANGGELWGIEFEMNNAGDFISPEFEVWIGETDKDNFSDGQFVDPETLTKVFKGRLQVENSTSRQVSIPFDAPYEWRGQNLVVYTHVASDNFTPFKAFRTLSSKKKAAARSIWAASDNAPFNPLNPGDGGTVVDELPIAGFYWTDRSSLRSIEGKVVNAENQPIKNARVGLEDSKYFTVSDNTGAFKLENLYDGSYRLTAKAYGYQDAAPVAVTVAGADLTQNITLTEIPTHDIVVKLRDADGENLKNADVRIIGYGNVKAQKGEEDVVLKDVYISDKPYSIEIENSGWKALYKEQNLNEVNTLAFTLKEEINAPSELALLSSGKNIHVQWSDPKDRFYLDYGAPVEKLGYDMGTKYSVIGVAFHNDAVINEIQWRLDNSEDMKRDKVNLFIIELGKDGWPTRNVLCAAENVPNIDGQWNAVKIPQDVVAPNGFFVGLSVNSGFAGLAVAQLRDSMELRPQRFFTSSEFTFNAPGTREGLWVDNYGTANGGYVPMIRAIGTDNGYIDRTDYSPVEIDWNQKGGETARLDRPDITYSVYLDGKRISEGLTETSTELTDLAEGDHVIAVTANYASGESEKIEAEIKISGVGIESVEWSGKPVLVPNPCTTTLTVDAPDAATLILTNFSGQYVKTYRLAGNKVVDVTDLPAGFYIGTVVTTTGKRTHEKLIKK